MAGLVRIGTQHHASFLGFWDELVAHGEDPQTWLNMVDDRPREELADPEGFADWVAAVEAAEHTPEHALAPGWVRASTRYWAEDGELIGRVNIRHELTERLRREGGHIGYIVRPSYRRQGHATRLLAASLPLAADLDIGSALLTTDEANLGSIRAIESNGGVLQDVLDGTRRYWISTTGH